MKRLEILIFLILVIMSFRVNAQWEMKNNGLPESWAPSAAISAAGEKTACAKISNELYLTTDAGDSWNSVPLPAIYNNSSLDVIEIANDKIFWIGLNESLPYAGRIFKTTDGGENWQLQFEDPDNASFINYIEFFDELNGVAMSDPPFPNSDKPAHFIKTTDGGTTWIPFDNSTLTGMFSGDTWRRIDFVDPNNGYFFESGVNPQKLYKIDSSGIWLKTNFFGYAAVLKFQNNFKGIAASNQGEIYLTDDGANSWTKLSSKFDGWPTDIEFIGGGNRVYLSSDDLLYSNDGGMSWNISSYPGDEKVMDIEFTDETHGWFITTTKIYYTQNGGDLVVNINDEETAPAGFNLRQNYPNPFNPATTIRYSISAVEAPGSAPVSVETRRGATVQLTIYDILGNEIVKPVNEYQSPGEYEIKFDGSRLPSGVYFYSLSMDNFQLTKKMTLIK